MTNYDKFGQQLRAMTANMEIDLTVEEPTATGKCYLTNLPSEILLEIAYYLSIAGVVNLGNTCKYLFRICDDNKVWVKHLVRNLHMDTGKYEGAYYKRSFVVASLSKFFNPVKKNNRSVEVKYMYKEDTCFEKELKINNVNREVENILKDFARHVTTAKTKAAVSQLHTDTLNKIRRCMLKLEAVALKEHATRHIKARRVRSFALWQTKHISTAALLF